MDHFEVKSHSENILSKLPKENRIHLFFRPEIVPSWVYISSNKLNLRHTFSPHVMDPRTNMPTLKEVLEMVDCEYFDEVWFYIDEMSAYYVDIWAMPGEEIKNYLTPGWYNAVVFQPAEDD